MTERRLNTASLYGGINQQPPQLRFPTQVEDAENASFSVFNGASKRPGSIFITEIEDLDSEGDYRLHAINRDNDERYIVIYGEGTLRVFELDGLEATLTISTEAQAYLDENTPTSSQLRLVTIRDYTIIVNTTVPVQAATSASYTIAKTHQSYAVMTSNTPAVNSYHKISESSSNAAEHYQYVPGDSSTFATLKCETVSGSSFGSPNGEYNESGNQPGGFKVGFQRYNLDITGGGWTESTLTLTKTGAFASYTFNAGDQIYITGGTNVTAGWYVIASKVSNDAITLTVTCTSVPGDQSDLTTDAIGNEYEVTVDFSVTYATMYDLALAFQEALQDAGATDALIAWTSTGNQAGYFTITSPYRGSSALIFNPTAPSAGYDYTSSSRPFKGQTSTAGTGSPPTDTKPVDDRWVSVGAPNQATAILDDETMPIQMVRTAYTGDGVTPAEFDVDLIEWSPRSSGDENNNPVPSLWADGSKIADVTEHRNRLVLVGDVNIVMSQAGDLFNFYLENANNIVDSDPIDLQLTGDSNEEVPIISYVASFNKALVFFTEAGSQFELNAPEALTPSTAAITPSTSYKTLPIRPQPTDTTLYFLARLKDSAILYEYYYQEARVALRAVDVTRHVPRLLPLDARTIRASTNNETVFVLPNNCNKIYTYKYFWNGDQKQQSAWSKWVFDGDYIIKDITAINDDLYMLSEWSGIYTIEKVAIARQIL